LADPVGFLLGGKSQMFTRSELVKELKGLKRGRGVLSDDIDRLVGPALRHVCGTGPVVPTELLREQVSRVLRREAAHLPNDQRYAVLAALALMPNMPPDEQRFLGRRMKWMLQHHRTGYSERTAARSCDAGLIRIADRLLPENDPGRNNRFTGGAWHTVRLISSVRLDRDPPELHERRLIAADKDGLDKITTSFTVPQNTAEAAAPDVRIRIGDTGDFTVMKQATPGHYQADIPLPHPLDRGETWEYDATFVPSPDAKLLPHYYLSPLRPCGEFLLEVRFRPDRTPRKVWRLDGVPTSAAPKAGSDDDLLPPDPSGRVETRFEHLAIGLSYGVRWSHA